MKSIVFPCCLKFKVWPCSLASAREETEGRGKKIFRLTEPAKKPLFKWLVEPEHQSLYPSKEELCGENVLPSSPGRSCRVTFASRLSLSLSLPPSLPLSLSLSLCSTILSSVRADNRSAFPRVYTVCIPRQLIIQDLGRIEQARLTGNETLPPILDCLSRINK